MNKVVLNCMLILGILISSNFVIAQESNFDPFKLKAEYFNDKGVKDKMVFSDKKGNSFKIKKSDFSNGVYIKQGEKWLKHGVWLSTYEGRITEKIVYSFGKKHGVRESYYENGKVQFEDQFVKGVQQGISFQYRADGTKVYECPYVIGKKEGVKIEYERNGSISFKKNYKNGKLQGEYLQYNNDGKLVARTYYELGKQVGKTEWY
ncbi:MAG: hypothetical protein COA50_08395 [Flavobacteriaceae bacterium]|nr:hypothetical protein [Sneathiella sp.]PCJ95632.1 MAG: hypothetical protein COA50_08395 [Flavobacteriaceae bacterium]